METDQPADAPRRRARKSDREIVEALDVQIEQLTRRRDAANAREAERKRKLRARRMIILGSALVKRASDGSTDARTLVETIIHHASERDREAFDGWNPFGGEDDEC